MSVPRIRFKRDDGSEYPEWTNKTIGDILTICHGKDYKEVENKNGKNPVLGTGGVITYTDDSLCDWNCVCIGRKGTIDKPIYMDKPFWCVDTLFYSKPHDGENPLFQYNLFQTVPWLKYNEASGVPSLSAKTISGISVDVPHPEEQTKIATFLSQVDDVISASKEEVAKLEQLKKGMMQKIFSQEVRFKKDDGSNYPEWEKTILGKETKPYIVRNKKKLPLDIYSINNVSGFVPQEEQFDNAGYLNEVDTSIYMIVPNKHFAYNPARINVGSIGYQNLGYDVQVSSLYEVFSTSEKVIDDFLWVWFHAFEFQKNIMRLQEGGVRQYFYYNKLQETPIWLPSPEEQTKIAEFFTSMDDAIAAAKEELEKYKELKKGLLQQMFV